MCIESCFPVTYLLFGFEQRMFPGADFIRMPGIIPHGSCMISDHVCDTESIRS